MPTHISPFPGQPIRDQGKWTAAGDSLQSGFGGAVPWLTQASSHWRPDVMATANLGVAGQSVGPAATVGTMLHATQLAAFDGNYDAAKDYNMGSIWGGANDLQAGRTGADIYTDLTSWKTGRAAVGFLTLAFCCVRMNKPAGFQAERLILNSAILGNAAGFDGVVDMDSIPGSPGDGINYDIDGIHLTTAGQTFAMNLILPVWRSIVGL